MRDGRDFEPVDHVDRFGVTFTAKSFVDKSLSLTSSNVKQRILQGGVEISSPDALDLTQKASVELVRDCALRDPAGNMIRIQERR